MTISFEELERVAEFMEKHRITVFKVGDVSLERPEKRETPVFPTEQEILKAAPKVSDEDLLFNPLAGLGDKTNG